MVFELDKLRGIRENLIFRALLSPYYKVKRLIEKKKFKTSEDSRILKELHGIHNGKRCFIIGNGPSLTEKDLDLIRGEYSFASNQIYKIFNRTLWRPTYYVVTDKSLLCKEFRDKKDIDVDCEKKFYDVFAKQLSKDIKNTAFILAQPGYTINTFNEKPKFSMDVSQYVSQGQTVTYAIMQIAAYMGFNEMYLLGIDFSMPYYTDKFGRRYKSDETREHFEGADIRYNNYVVPLNRQSVLNAYNDAKQYADSNDIKIYNATRGGNLEVFERVKLEEVIKGNV